METPRASAVEPSFIAPARQRNKKKKAPRTPKEALAAKVQARAPKPNARPAPRATQVEEDADET